MLKIFMTGDNHIGLKYGGHENAEILVSSRIQAFETMVQTANQENCDLFVITGDLFENIYSIRKRDVQHLLDILSRFIGMVIVLPGNHDYYDEEAKVWKYFKDVMSQKDNIMLLTAYRPYTVPAIHENVVLYPALCTSLHSVSGQNHLGWIKEENIVPDCTYRIGIAHGSVEGETIDNEGRYFPMNRDELENIPVDVWLIGHTHVPFPRNLTEEYTVGEKIFNAGTHVQTDVSCNTEGQCFILEIDEHKTVRAKKIISGNLRFYHKAIVLTANEMESILDRELGNIDDNSVVDIILSGAVTSDEYSNRKSMIEKKLSRFIEGTYDDSALSLLISKDLIHAEFPETSFSAGLLTALLDEPKEAQLAYELLNELKGGK